MWLGWRVWNLHPDAVCQWTVTVTGWREKEITGNLFKAVRCKILESKEENEGKKERVNRFLSRFSWFSFTTFCSFWAAAYKILLFLYWRKALIKLPVQTFLIAEWHRIVLSIIFYRHRYCDFHKCLNTYPFPAGKTEAGRGCSPRLNKCNWQWPYETLKTHFVLKIPRAASQTT